MAMLLNRAYYFLKPAMPWSLRMLLRRARASYKRHRYSDVWPIDPESGETPPNWPGWPAGKKFAFVLTHDVEGQKGLDQVERLMDVEARYGFRSSFNFVPEGQYRVPDRLRQNVQAGGFEVGVHGLHHDGKLYGSKATFAARAAKIRDYVREWKAQGFRSPYMHHRLAWLHQVGVEYDASTFDTDPFEPESDGVGTIFPFWVPGTREADGYVELPYTLVQDFSLFVLLREPNIDIWKRKLDWIAANGGMALLNTHPDYMHFEGGSPRRDEFPIARYEELLAYVRDHYADSCWKALPREVNDHYRAAVPAALRNTRKKVCMVTYSYYEYDNRVRRYAEALVSRGDRVDVIAIAAGDAPTGTSKLEGVTVHRVQNRKRDEQGKWDYAWRLVGFWIRSSRLLTRRHRRLGYDLIHVHNIPDFLIFTAWYPKWTGCKLVLDIHDIVPEFFASKFGLNETSSYVALLKWLEKTSMRFADHVIISNQLWYNTLTARSVPAAKASVFLNYVDLRLFFPRPRTRTDDKVILIYPGCLQPHQGLDVAIRAFARLKEQVPNSEFHIYGDGAARSSLVELTRQLGLNGSVLFRGAIPLEQVAEAIANADIGVVPKRADTFGNEAFSTKIMEFMTQHVPVVASRTKIDTLYFDSLVHFFPSGDSAAMAAALLDVLTDQSLRDALVTGGNGFVERNHWEVHKARYLGLADSLSSELFGEAGLPDAAAAGAGVLRQMSVDARVSLSAPGARPHHDPQNQISSGASEDRVRGGVR